MTNIRNILIIAIFLISCESQNEGNNMAEIEKKIEIGIQKEFSDNGALKNIKEYIIPWWSDEPYLNQFIAIDKNQQIIDSISYYYSVKIINDYIEIQYHEGGEIDFNGVYFVKDKKGEEAFRLIYDRLLEENKIDRLEDVFLMDKNKKVLVPHDSELSGSIIAIYKEVAEEGVNYKNEGIEVNYPENYLLEDRW